MIYEARLYVDTPVMMTVPIHFDALLASVHPAMHNLKQVTRFSKAEDVVTAPLPLDSAKAGNAWIWCASTGEFDDQAIAFDDKFNKRKDHTDYLYAQKRLTPRTGPGRDRMETAYGVLCKYMSFVYSTTAPKETDRIIKRIRSIGGLRKMGYGNVTGYEVTEIGLNWRECLVKDGMARRHLPTSMAIGEITEACVTPPYWLASNKVPAIFTGSECELKDGVRLNEFKRN